MDYPKNVCKWSTSNTAATHVCVLIVAWTNTWNQRKSAAVRAPFRSKPQLFGLLGEEIKTCFSDVLVWRYGSTGWPLVFFLGKCPKRVLEIILSQFARARALHMRLWMLAAFCRHVGRRGEGGSYCSRLFTRIFMKNFPLVNHHENCS